MNTFSGVSRTPFSVGQQRHRFRRVGTRRRLAVSGNYLSIAPRVQRLLLGGGHHGPPWALQRSVLPCLRHNSHLQTLDLAHNVAGEAVALALADLLEVNTTLHRINIASNGIGDNGLCALLDALKVNTGARRLDVSDNWVGHAGALALAAALKDLRLEELNLMGNALGPKGTLALSRALRKTPHVSVTHGHSSTEPQVKKKAPVPSVQVCTVCVGMCAGLRAPAGGWRRAGPLGRGAWRKAGGGGVWDGARACAGGRQEACGTAGKGGV